MNTNQSALVLHSGGQDSTTCLYWAIKNFKEVRTLCITYGQRHAYEVEIARKIAEKAGVPFQIMDASIISLLSDNSLTNHNMIMDQEKPEDSYPNTFVPGRNLFFLTFAAVIARSHNIRNLVTGVSQADYSGYPDCRDTFIRSANATLNLAMDEQFIIHTPLMWLSKAETWAMADELGVFDLVRNDTLTCYNGVIAEGCGHCPACKLRNEGLKEYLKLKLATDVVTLLPVREKVKEEKHSPLYYELQSAFRDVKLMIDGKKKEKTAEEFLAELSDEYERK